MTLPNRPTYTPGEKRRECKYHQLTSISPVVESSTAGYNGKNPRNGKQKAKRRVMLEPDDDEQDAVQHELMTVLTAIAPVTGFVTTNGMVDSTTRSQSIELQHVKSFVSAMGTKEELKLHAEVARKRLVDGHVYERASILAFNSSAIASQALLPDTFAAALELLPPLQDANLGDTAMLSANAKLRRLEAVTLQGLSPALDMLEDSSLRDTYHQTVSTLHEWGKRKVQQLQQQQAQSDGMSTPTPSSPSRLQLQLRTPPPTRKRTNLSKTAKTVLRNWFEQHLHHPYPTEEEKDSLALKGGITIDQVNNWFINTRGRKWKPMLTRLMAEKQAGECKLYDQMVEKIEAPYRRAPTDL